MNIFDILTLFGGLAMFLYGMRLMGDGLKESSSGQLKVLMEHVTNNPLKAFLLGAAVTALIQSSTATIVITSGLAAAGILTLHQSLGIIVGANVGTTITGQIIRLLDVSADSAAWLQIFKPSTLAPLALISGIILIMGFRYKNSRTIGSILMGFGILFSGLLNMTAAVDSLAETPVVSALFTSLGENPLIGYLTGAGVAFVLQSSSATIGILQAFASSGKLTFSAVYSVIVGVYLGDCVTTAIVCSIGAKAEAKRIGAVNILYNLCKSALILVSVTILHQAGVLKPVWQMTATPGVIANANTIFNLVSAAVLLPGISLLEKASRRIIQDDPEEAMPYQHLIEALSPNFFNTPALALRSCYDVLMQMFTASRMNIERAFALLSEYDEKTLAQLKKDEDGVDQMTDAVGNYLAELSGHLKSEYHLSILNQYYKVMVEFERLGDYAVNISEKAADLHERKIPLSATASSELLILQDVIANILDETRLSFEKRDVDAAYRIEPLEEVVDDLVDAMKQNHLKRLAEGVCNIYAGTDFMDLLSDIERVSDICSNVGLATVVRANPGVGSQTHDYIYNLHAGHDAKFNREYSAAHDSYFRKLDEVMEISVPDDNADVSD